MYIIKFIWFKILNSSLQVHKKKKKIRKYLFMLRFEMILKVFKFFKRIQSILILLCG